MSEQIWKFPFRVDDELAIPMPQGATVLSVAMQGAVPCIWARVDTEAALVKRAFCVRGTGHEVGTVGAYVGTFQMAGGALVFHLFEAQP